MSERFSIVGLEYHSAEVEVGMMLTLLDLFQGCNAVVLTVTHNDYLNGVTELVPRVMTRNGSVVDIRNVLSLEN